MTDLDPETLDRIEADLRNAVGKEAAITSGELAARHIPNDGEANPTTREIVKEVMMRERGLPIVSCSNGYYIPEDRETIDDELESLRGRIAGIEDRMQLLASNWKVWRTATDSGTVAEAKSEWETMSKAERERVRKDPVLDPADFKGSEE